MITDEERIDFIEKQMPNYYTKGTHHKSGRKLIFIVINTYHDNEMDEYEFSGDNFRETIDQAINYLKAIQICNCSACKGEDSGKRT